MMNDLYNLILKGGLRKYKFTNSKIKPIDYSEDMKGSVFAFRSKELMQDSKGFIITSEEAVSEQKEITHWTPNIYRYGKYVDNKKIIVKGHEEKNLRQINTFVVDIDDNTITESEILLSCYDMGFLPTIIMKTPGGYQVYFVLDKPVFITAKSNFKAIEIAKKVSNQLRKSLGETLRVDTKCNHFRIFRFPQKSNIVFFEKSYLCNFATLINWSMKKEDSPKKTKMKLVKSFKQVDEPWFNLLLNESDIKGEKGTMGRNNVVLTLSLAMYASGRSKENCLYNLTEFNYRLENPLSDNELERTVNSAYSGKYKGASKAFITTLCTEWVNRDLKSSDLFSTTGWYKFAKPREERVRSHYEEWVEDLEQLINDKTNVNQPFLRIKRQELIDRLGIANSSLTALFKRLKATNKINVQTIRGRNGGVILALVKNILINQIKNHHKQAKKALQEYLGINLDTLKNVNQSKNDYQEITLDTG
ncbi:primase C-terminal domain-containing protein [Ligilactobacillus salivarius]|uniref:primase C-terminal domain-containing protein n=1 Tax=Ligilactobacillus salivarius TaxID=1624 RepID=UPI00177AF7A7|nr:primase C-terminal domain-containing protein [Ligilactobacillus salivarius]QXL50323.1 primase C-terminal domain-containing protein [Ligilactobacillus salivarius]